MIGYFIVFFIIDNVMFYKYNIICFLVVKNNKKKSIIIIFVFKK